MLKPTSPKAKECYERAREARERALRASDPRDGSEFLTEETRWFKLAQSHELSDRLTQFSKSSPLAPKRTPHESDTRNDKTAVTEEQPGQPRNAYETNRLLGRLAPHTFELIRPHLRSISLAQGRELYRAGDPIEEIYFPQSGLIALMVATKDGRLIETSIVGREGAIGLQAGLGPRLSFVTAVTQIAGHFSIIRADYFAKIAEKDRVLRDFIESEIEWCWMEAQQTAACNAVHDAAARLSRCLLQCADQTGGNEIVLTQDTLAEMLGLRRTTITMLAKSLQSDGLIKYRRGRIGILDREALKHRACECYEVLRQRNLQSSTAPETI